MTIEQNFFRQVMGQFVTGVTVVTTRSPEGIAGLTVNSFTSVSLEPPLVLVCVELRSQALPFIRKGGIFAVNMLTNKQEALSRCFATSSAERYTHFCHASYRVAATGAPILDGALAFIDARIVAEYPAGDHAIFLGQVEAMGTEGRMVFGANTSREQNTLVEWAETMEHKEDSEKQGHNHAHPWQPLPLVYYRGQYRHVSTDYAKPSLTAHHDEDAD